MNRQDTVPQEPGEPLVWQTARFGACPALQPSTRLSPLLSSRHDREQVLGPLATFAPIDLAHMNRVALLSRYEVKYVMHLQTVLGVLDKLSASYQVLEVAGQRCSRYRTLYFDTPDFALYQRHHAGLKNRYKIRSRKYMESNGAFLEIKHKNNKDRTIKSRIQTADQLTELNHTGMNHTVTSFLRDQSPYTADELQPCLWNGYSRITLVNQAQTERVTLDIDLDFAWQTNRVGLPGIVIAEVKQEGSAAPSEFIDLMRTQHVARSSFSKYCIGASLLYPHLKYNNFKATYRLINKLMAASL